MKQGLILLGAGAVTEALYLAVTLRLPWWRYGGALQSWRDLLGAVYGAFWICLAGALLLLTIYVLGWRALRRLNRRQQEVQGRLVWFFALAFSATLFWLMPITSDLFNYLGQAHLFTDLGANPLLEPAAEVNEAVLAKGGSSDPLLSTYATVYAATPSIYGPAWTLISAPATLGPSETAFGLSYLKGLACLAFLGSAWLVQKIVGKLRPASAVEALYLFAWNPLVLLMAVGDGHNDMVMMAAVLLGFWFLLQESWVLAFGALAFSASIKYVGALFVPLFVLYTWDRSMHRSQRGPWPALLRGGFATVAVTGLLYAPLGSLEWGASVLLRLLKPANWAMTSAPQPAARIFWAEYVAGSVSQEVLAWLPTLALVGGLFAFAVAYLYLIARLRLGLKEERFNTCLPRMARRRRGRFSLQKAKAQQLFDASFTVSLLIFVLGAARSQPWYLIWPASLAGFSTQRRAWPALIALSAVMLLSQIWVEWGSPGLVTLISEVI